MVNFFSYFLTCSNTSTVNDVVGNHICCSRSKKGHSFCLVSQLHGVNSEISNTLVSFATSSLAKERENNVMKDSLMKDLFISS